MLLKLMATSIISIQKSHPFALLEQLLHTMPVVGVGQSKGRGTMQAGWLLSALSLEGRR